MGRGSHFAPPVAGDVFFASIEEGLEANLTHARENLRWLRRSLHPYFFITMADEREALLNLTSGLHTLAPGNRLVLAEGEGRIVTATLSTPGSFYESLRGQEDRPLSYIELSHSTGPVPGSRFLLELQRLEFPTDASGEPAPPDLPPSRLAAVSRAFAHLYPRSDASGLERDFRLLAASNPRYARISPPERTARAIWLLRQGQENNGLYFNTEQTLDFRRHRETRLLFVVGNPPIKGFAAQALEVLNRLRVSVRRAYCLVVDSGEGPFFLCTFYVRKRGGQSLHRGSPLFARLKAELYNTQILSTTSRPYRRLVAGGLTSGEDASLVNAFTAFCFTTLGHSHPDRFGHQEVSRAFAVNPEITRLLCRLFRIRFDPDRTGREKLLARATAETRRAVESYNTGHRHLDGMRRTIYRTAQLFILRCLKTNFFVPEKHALAFRLDPAYLEEIGGEFTADLPAAAPFRVTFFCGRHGAGYHVGFADIARGGWRTVVCIDEDDYNENLGSVFREAFVLAHTQHLKNKDIYEGGSKLVVALDASDAAPGPGRRHRLHALQYGFVNAFFDIFASRSGLCHRRVVDYYGEAEAIELGPDENMDDTMIELIARQAVRREYLLGRGVISSKKVGISHRRWGVTSLGVVTFADAALKELGIDISRDAFSVKMTGGPHGDVAGNLIGILLERCPKVKFVLIADGSGALFDPRGIDGAELRRLLLSESIDAFAPEKIGPGGFLLSRRRRKVSGTRVLYLRQRRPARGLRKEWVTADEVNEQFEDLTFSVEADLFVPAGGRPETVNDENWTRFLDGGKGGTCRVIVEGANSFLTPGARRSLQEQGVIVIRDASANKCGVIASSYEIIANLLMSDEEFLACEQKYVADVLSILARRAGDEAELIFQRRRESQGTLLCTEISDSLSIEINSLYDRIFALLIERPEMLRRPAFRRALLAHLPALVVRRPNLRRRVSRLPPKYRCAMTAGEIAAAIVYGGGLQEDFSHDLTDWVAAKFAK